MDLVRNEDFGTYCIVDVEPSGDTTYSKFLEVEKRDDSHLYSTAHKRRKSGENM